MEKSSIEGNIGIKRPDPRERAGKRTEQVISEDNRSRELKIRIQTGRSHSSLTERYDIDHFVPWGNVVDTDAEGTDGSGYILTGIDHSNLRYEEVNPIIRDSLHVGFNLRAECYSDHSFGNFGVWEVKFKYFWKNI